MKSFIILYVYSKTMISEKTIKNRSEFHDVDVNSSHFLLHSRNINSDAIKNTILELLRNAVTTLPPDGMPEAIWVFETKNFWPLIVSIDTDENSLYENVEKNVEKNVVKVRKRLGL